MNDLAAVTWADPVLDPAADPEAVLEELLLLVLLLEQAATARDMIATIPSMAGVVRLQRRTVK
jgi:hypothetical protein